MLFAVLPSIGIFAALLHETNSIFFLNGEGGGKGPQHALGDCTPFVHFCQKAPFSHLELRNSGTLVENSFHLGQDVHCSSIFSFPLFSCQQEPLRRKPRKDSVSFPSKDLQMSFFITALATGSMIVCTKAKQSSSMLRKAKRDRRLPTLSPHNEGASSLCSAFSRAQGEAIIFLSTSAEHAI